MPAAAPHHALPFWLHSRYVLVATALLALLAVLTGVAFVAFERHALEQRTQAENELFARVLEDQANRTFNGIDVALRAAAETVHAAGADDHAPPAALSTALQQALQALPFLRSVSLLDADGRVLASSNPANLGRQVVRERLLPAGASGGLGPLLAGRDLGDLAGGSAAATGQRLLPLVHPLGSEATDRWLVAAVNPDYFANQYGLLLGKAAMRAALLSYDGQLIAASEGVRHAAGERIAGLPLFGQFLPARERGSYLGTGLDGAPAHASFRSARRLPLVLLVETPAATVAAQVAAVARGTALAGAVLLALIAGLGALAWRSLRGHEAVSDDLLAARGTLAAHDAFTDRLFQLSPIPMVVKDLQGRFVRVNQAWTELTGMAPERMIGSSLGRLYPAHLAGPHEVQEQMAIATSQALTYEEQLLDRDGLPRDVMIRVTPYSDAGGAIAGVIGCLMDVTEFREAAQRTLEAKDAAERANAAKSEFLANISHELRTPLQTILGFSELGGLRTRGDAKVQDMFGDIHAAGERMLSLVNNLLDLSRLESTVGEIQLRTSDIAPALQAVQDELQPLAARRGLRLVRSAAPEAAAAGGGGGSGSSGLWAQADTFRLQQVLRNVLANAIRFAPEGSDIELDWRRDGPAEVLVTVRDHGPGVPPDELDSIFHAFVQSSRTKDGSGGTGLGLAICRKIMAAHQGSIVARNHPDGGAVFELRLPAVAQPTTPEHAVAARPGTVHDLG